MTCRSGSGALAGVATTIAVSTGSTFGSAGGGGGELGAGAGALCALMSSAARGAGVASTTVAAAGCATGAGFRVAAPSEGRFAGAAATGLAVASFGAACLGTAAWLGVKATLGRGSAARRVLPPGSGECCGQRASCPSTRGAILPLLGVAVAASGAASAARHTMATARGRLARPLLG